jgi:uncharacterized protein
MYINLPNLEIRWKNRLYTAGKSAMQLAAMLLFGVLASCSLLLFQAQANEQKVVDDANLLTDSEESSLQKQFEKIAEKYDCDIAVVTVDSCNGQTPQNFTDQYYYDHSYGIGDDQSGILLMVCMKERKFHLSTNGDAIWMFTDYGLEVIDDSITEDLSDGEYYNAFHTYGTLAARFMKEALEDEPYDISHEYSEPLDIRIRLLISLGVGLVLGAIVLAVLYGQLKTVGMKHAARDYVKDGSFHVTRSNDIFLYRNVTRHRIERNQGGGPGGHGGPGGSSMHSSPGGHSGGRTGSF